MCCIFRASSTLKLYNFLIVSVGNAAFEKEGGMLRIVLTVPLSLSYMRLTDALVAFLYFKILAL